MGDTDNKGPRRGISFVNKSVNIGQVTDGTTTTVLVGELRIGLNAIDQRGTWAMSQCGASAICHNAVHLASPPNDCSPNADLMVGAGEIIREVGEPTLRAECMWVYGGLDSSYQSGVRSLHPGGANIAMADASVRFITDFIDTGIAAECEDWPSGNTDYTDCHRDPSKFGTWARLHVSNDEYPVGADF